MLVIDAEDWMGEMARTGHMVCLQQRRATGREDEHVVIVLDVQREVILENTSFIPTEHENISSMRVSQASSTSR